MEWFRLKPKQGVTVPHKLTGRRKSLHRNMQKKARNAEIRAEEAERKMREAEWDAEEAERKARR